MYGRAGIAYVYLVYGMYDCLNVVAGPDGQAAAVLIRAVEPLEGVESMRASRWAIASARRRRPWADARARDAAKARVDAMPDVKVASGPGAVGAAFGLDRDATGLDLCDERSDLRLTLRAAPLAEATIAVGARIGVDYAGPDWATRPWRFWIAGHPSVSRQPRAAR
jgi:DNA-3-methyladenine glycosylase